MAGIYVDVFVVVDALDDVSGSFDAVVIVVIVVEVVVVVVVVIVVAVGGKCCFCFCCWIVLPLVEIKLLLWLLHILSHWWPR